MDVAVGRSLVQRWRTRDEASARTVPGPAPVSTVQRGLLVFERLNPRTAVFNVCFAARHRGPLDEDRFDAALTTLLRRHPALRSTFAGGEGEPVRTIQDGGTLTARWADLRDLPADGRADAAREYAERLVVEPFDLVRGPLVRVHGFRLSDDERLLVFVAHHLVCDGVSMQVLLGELDAAYRGDLSGVVPEVIPAPVDLAALDYWRAKLAGVPDLDLPADFVRGAAPTFRAGSLPVELDEDVVARAERLAREEGTTLFAVVLAAFQLLLGEHSGQDDFAVGTPDAGRARPGQHNAVGLLADLLVLRTDLSGRPSFRELVRRARVTFLEAFAHRDVPFEDVVAAAGPGHTLDRSMVQATVVFHGERGEPTLAGAPLVPVPVSRPGLRYDVDLHLWREHGRLWGSWDYSADTFEPSSAARMAAQLPVLLARALAEPDRPVDRLDLVSAEDLAVLERWGRGPRPDDPDTTLVELFAAQVARTPDAVAVTDPRRALSYRALDERSNQLAHHLRGRGVRPGDIVGIRLPRTVDLAVAMLGIHKAGAAYLPLDPAYPADRTDYMLADSGARTVVTEADVSALDAQPVTPVGVRVPPDSLAYVLYTSGSTGRPKGVLLTHRNAVPMVLWGQRTFTPEQMSRVLASTSVCFDVSVFEFFGPLCAGGTVVVVDNALSLLADPPDVTMVCAVPSAARALIAANALPRSVSVVGLGGEAVTGTLVDDLHATGHVELVVNLYGPTEDTTYSTYAFLQPEEQPPPIGVPLPHERAYVLDRALRRVPVGAVGELYLAGRGLSRGYVSKPGLTASRYLADPYAEHPGERMYRTGDLVRYRADGSLLYLGRRDFQVKIRGQRIELGEIENTLQRHPGVHEAVVALHADRLVGYVTARTPGGLDVDDLRACLRRTLPVVMVPSSLLLLDELPHTPNGKVDRLSLPEPDGPVSTASGPPQGADEELVAEVWREVLDIEEIARDDDFFDLGGDSLLAGQVLNRLRERAGVGLPLRLVFENSRLADLAAALPPPEGAADDAAPARPTVEPRPADAEPVLSFDQQRVWLESQFKSTVAYNVHGRQWLRGPLDVPVLERSIRAIVARHETLRTTFAIVDGRPVQRVAGPDPGWRIDVADVCGAADEVAAAERLADAQAATAFDLATGPLFDVLLVRRSDTDHLLSITIHHIISDAWSIGLFLRELAALYGAGGDPERAELPELPVQYLDYAVAQRAWLSGDRLAAQVDYWRDRLAGAPPVLSLPAARRRSPAQANAGGRVRTRLTADDTAALHRLCREHDATPFMALLASLATVLRRWSGQDDLVVGVPVNTRPDAGTSALIGFFVNTVPLRVELVGDPSFSEVLRRVRTAALDGYLNHGDTPFDVLMRELRVVRDPARTPLFQVLVSMVDGADAAWELPGVAVERSEPPTQPGKFDLDLNVRLAGEEAELELLYHAERYDEATMRALLDQLGRLLAAAAADPERGILEYDLQAGPVPAAHAAVPVPAPHLALEHHARERADEVAVVDRHGPWTYQELADAAARVARIVAGGAGDGAEVGVVKRPAAAFVAAVLGCARAAVPYRLVDAGDTMVRHASVTAVLDPDPDERTVLDGAVDVRAVLREAAGGAGGGRDDGGPEPAEWAVSWFDLNADDRLAVVPGASGLRLLSALSAAVTAGATLLIPDDRLMDIPGALTTWLRDSAVTALYLGAPLLRSLPARNVVPVLPRLRYVFLDNRGDLTAHDVELVRQLAPSCRIVSVYRATATGQPLAIYAVPRSWSAHAAPLRVPIGTELSGSGGPVNAAGRPAAVGEVGELCFGAVRTGDLARRRPDGVLEFAGPAGAAQAATVRHADPLETVAALRDVPGVRDAVVVDRPGPDGQPVPTAYVASPGRSADLARLRQHLVTHLPEYLIPKQVVLLDRIPLTAAGDYDLGALPDPAHQGA